MRKLIIGSREFERRKLQECKEAGIDVILRRDFDTEIKAADEGRAFDFCISTASVDRYGDTIAVEGWQLAAFRKNPVVLWMHDNNLLPVAKAVNVRIEDGKLKSRAEFTPEGMLRFNDAVHDMLKGGFLSATSVGFIPLKYNFVDDPQRRFGIDFLEQELLEFSVVTVPANAEALIEGRSIAITEDVPERSAPTMALNLAQARVARLKLLAA